jgi:hypothetical protein
MDAYIYSEPESKEEEIGEKIKKKGTGLASYKRALARRLPLLSAGVVAVGVGC